MFYIMLNLSIKQLAINHSSGDEGGLYHLYDHLRTYEYRRTDCRIEKPTSRFCQFRTIALCENKLETNKNEHENSEYNTEEYGEIDYAQENISDIFCLEGILERRNRLRSGTRVYHSDSGLFLCIHMHDVNHR